MSGGEADKGRVPGAPGSTSLRSPEPVVSALSGDDPSRCETCPACHGDGRFIIDPSSGLDCDCETCDGTGRVRRFDPERVEDLFLGEALILEALDIAYHAGRLNYMHYSPARDVTCARMAALSWHRPSDTDRSGEADETAQQAQPEARAGAEGIAKDIPPPPTNGDGNGG